MRALGRWLLLVVVAALALQLFFIGRIAWMALVDPQSTAFQRSEAWRWRPAGSCAGGRTGATTNRFPTT